MMSGEAWNVEKSGRFSKISHRGVWALLWVLSASGTFGSCSGKKTTSCVGISDHVWTRHVIWVCIFTDGKLCSSISRTIRHWTSNKNVMDWNENGDRKNGPADVGARSLAQVSTWNRLCHCGNEAAFPRRPHQLRRYWSVSPPRRPASWLHNGSIHTLLCDLWTSRH